MNCFFIRLSRDYFPCTQRFFGAPVWGGITTLDVRFVPLKRWTRRGLGGVFVVFMPSRNLPRAGRISPRRAHTPPQPRTAHTAAHRAKQGRFRWGGWYHYPRRALRGPEPLRAQRSGGILCHFCMGREAVEKTESLRNGDAHRACLCSEAPRSRRAALLHCWFLRCTGELHGLSSLRRSADRDLLTDLLDSACRIRDSSLVTAVRFEDRCLCRSMRGTCLSE